MGGEQGHKRWQRERWKTTERIFVGFHEFSQ
jgi:hypothetical protein